MLKRTQVLMTDWQEEYIKDTAKRYDLSFSEVVRSFLSAGFLYFITAIHGEYKLRVSKKELARMIKKAGDHDTPRDEQYKMIAKLYFEARKAVEYRLERIVTQNKKSRS